MSSYSGITTSNLRTLVRSSFFSSSVADFVYQLTGGLRSGMGYCGCKTIPDLQQKATFIRQTVAGLREGHVHDVIITKEAPNYRAE